jgi:hypothetical protein
MFSWVFNRFANVVTESTRAFFNKDQASDPAKFVDEQGLRTDRVLNYVWINEKTAPEPSHSDALSTVPLHALDNVFQNARLYPDTKINIWVDDMLLNNTTRFFLTSQMHLSAPDNVQLRNLSEIKKYREWSITKFGCFPEHFLSDVYVRSDLSRFLVLQHCMQTENWQTIFYADMDMPDVDLDNVKTQKVLDKHQIAFTSATHLVDDEGEILSHGYIAVKCGGEDHILDRIVKSMALSVAYNTYPFSSLYNYLRADTMRRTRDQNIVERYFDKGIESYITNVPIPPIGYKMPVPKEYTEYDLCR